MKIKVSYSIRVAMCRAFELQTWPTERRLVRLTMPKKHLANGCQDRRHRRESHQARKGRS